MVKKITQIGMFLFTIILLAPAGLIAQDTSENILKTASFNSPSINYPQWEARTDLLAEKSPLLNISDTHRQINGSDFETILLTSPSCSLSRKPAIGKFFGIHVVEKVENSQGMYKNTTRQNQKNDISYFVTNTTNENGNKILLAFFEEDK